MDRQQFAQLMNEDLGTEYRSIVQYNQHIATLKGLRSPEPDRASCAST